MRPPMWTRLTQNMACFIAWISGSNRQSLTWDSDIARRQGPCSAPRVQAPRMRVAVRSGLRSSASVQDCQCAAATHSRHAEVLRCWEPHGPREWDTLPICIAQLLLPQPQSTSFQTSYMAKAHWEPPPDPEYIYPAHRPSGVRSRQEHERLPYSKEHYHMLAGVFEVLQVVLPALQVTPVESAVAASIMQSTLSPTMCAEGTMPKPSEESEPREGEPKARASKQPRSRFRADGRRRRTPGELKKRAPYGRMCKLGGGRAMGRDRSTSASTRTKTRGPQRQRLEQEASPWPLAKLVYQRLVGVPLRRQLHGMSPGKRGSLMRWTAEISPQTPPNTVGPGRARRDDDGFSSDSSVPRTAWEATSPHAAGDQTVQKYSEEFVRRQEADAL